MTDIIDKLWKFATMPEYKSRGEGFYLPEGVKFHDYSDGMKELGSSFADKFIKAYRTLDLVALCKKADIPVVYGRTTGGYPGYCRSDGTVEIDSRLSGPKRDMVLGHELIEYLFGHVLKRQISHKDLKPVAEGFLDKLGKKTAAYLTSITPLKEKPEYAYATGAAADIAKDPKKPIKNPIKPVDAKNWYPYILFKKYWNAGVLSKKWNAALDKLDEGTGYRGILNILLGRGDGEKIFKRYEDLGKKADETATKGKPQPAPVPVPVNA